MKLKPEEAEAVAFMQWARTCLPRGISCVLVHIPLERRSSRLNRMFFGRIGVRSGVSDYLLACPAHGYHGLFIELKRADKRAKPSAAQLDWLLDVGRMGFAGGVARGGAAAAGLVFDYLTGVFPVEEGEIIVEARQTYPPSLGSWSLTV